MKIDFKKLSKSKGYQKLKKAVLKDCMSNHSSSKCFITSKRKDCGELLKNRNECRRCYKFKWIIGRVQHYAHKTGLDPVFLLDKWEEDRSYWYQNYYQDCNQPKIIGKNVLVYETSKDAYIDFMEQGFVCPACGKVTKNPQTCSHCDWKAYGLFGTLGKGTFLFIKAEGRGMNIFMPVVKQEGR